LTDGRTKAACCTVEKAPPKPASCSADLCSKIPGYCNNDSDDESANGFTKRDLALSDASDPAKWKLLQKRGSGKIYQTNLGNNVGISIIGLAYPRLVELFGLQNGVQILRRFFRLIPGYCTGTAVQTQDIPPGHTVTTADTRGFETEHVIDVSLFGLHWTTIEY